ncbi:P-loop containing nucleoside triphosphate hydrolase protein [Boeremia exigua]|uniref:P-loop containing nucleoside triphosphate hydrolase protein n=1 Tax=Boeremia exigua TaxID=749465 RepID=UPI001E8E60E2|nr:P-loop containing nucleoside triphosphate hydrolase protein [Boeremia exigua]KAH6642222.1 P-loop containing nucleoside triphosphate hydrolase protein [Boeremia exigua]
MTSRCVRPVPPDFPPMTGCVYRSADITPSYRTTNESDDDAEPEEEGVNVEPGMLVESKDLYRSDPRAEWAVWAPDDIGIDSKETKASAKFALIVKREKIQEDDGSSALKVHSVQVQSPLIKDSLGPVFAGYPGIKTSLKRLRFAAPFREFFYRWTEFVQASRDSRQDETKAAHFKLLFDIISTEIQPQIEEVKDLVANEVINFTYLWAIFEPDMEVYSLVDGQHRLYRMKSATYVDTPSGKKLFQLSCQFVDTDGIDFGYNSTTLSIREFADVVSIVNLTIVPAHIKPGIDSIRTQLTQRGKRFENLKGCHYKAYSGDQILANPSPYISQKVNLRNGRIMIDNAMYDRYNKGNEKSLQPLNSPNSARPNGSSGIGFDVFDAFDLSYQYAPPVYNAMRQSMQRAKHQEAQMQFQAKHDSGTSLAEEHYAFCTSMVRGFCLTSKKWVSVYVDKVAEISWNEEAFERLVLPHDNKRLIKAFVQTQLNSEDAFDDVMSGKGQGIIMLLSGEPGTGKTLTAESVAEVMRSPLYSIGAGELGETADEVENNLRRVLEVSTKWGAVLLLDECDVFLERRSAKSIQRNKLVSVFLRLLEYYQGVMFLTTNRMEAHDPAFESRIHLTIQFPKLSFDSRLHIWKTFVRPKQSESKYASNIDDEELEHLAKLDLNGRQIKNVVKTARLLAASEKTSLEMDHIDAVLMVK